HLAPQRVVVVHRAERTLVVVQVDAVQLDVLPVEEDPLGRVEGQPADPECRARRVDTPAVLQYLGAKRVQIRMTRRPQAGMLDAKLRAVGARAAGRKLYPAARA